MTPIHGSFVAESFAREGHVAHAVTACYEALSSDERDPMIHALLADLFLDGDFYEEAIRSASRAIELDADCAPAYLSLGMAYDRRGGMRQVPAGTSARQGRRWIAPRRQEGAWPDCRGVVARG